MFELLRILLCGIGVVYLVIRFGHFLRSLAGGRSLWSPALAPEDRSHPDGHAQPQTSEHVVEPGLRPTRSFRPRQ